MMIVMMLKWNNGRGKWSRMQIQSFLCFSKKIAFHFWRRKATIEKSKYARRKDPLFEQIFLNNKHVWKIQNENENDWIVQRSNTLLRQILRRQCNCRCRIFNDIMYAYWIDDVAFQFFTVFQIELKREQKRKIKLPQEVWYNCTYRSIYIWYA